jgi:alkanesulfonate monooxygenase SsuD/methylene tetrahydromethanopterin reductase-like flavin-dependent oxidoreductase (luciferase family)
MSDETHPRSSTRLGGLAVAPTQEEADRRAAAYQAARGIDHEMLRSVLAWGEPDAVAERVQQYLDAGLDGVIFNMLGSTPDDVAFAGRVLTDRFGSG